MTQRHVLVEHLSNINSVIKQPLQLTHRIKFTCFDVSPNYIVFGATSGGLYIFNRYPHGFIKLIPSKHGSVVQVNISVNEKTIALASSKGLIIIIQNCFTETNAQYQVFSEHEGNTVTAIKWNLDDLYCGDNKGKVSVITLPSLLTKAIFQTPSASLMRLDSSVVQIECYSKFLLISTHTRTYICDTDKEQYRQIGKKLRDGRFGACFFSSDVTSEITSAHASTSRGLFKKMKDDEQFIALINDNVKILCARPGARMWEAKLDGSVTRTHQFKNALSRELTNLIQLDGDVDSHIIVDDFRVSGNSTPELSNFTKVLMLGSKFMVTFNNQSFYIFDCETMSVVCWCKNFSNIKDIKIIKNFIYIWSQTAELFVVRFYNLEEIVLKTLFDRQYYICGELCVNYMQDILGLVETSNKIHLVSILKEKLTELKAAELLTILLPLFKAIQDFSDKKCVNQRLATGIVIVNNAYIDKNIIFDEPCESNNWEQDAHLPETLQTLKEISSNVTDKLTEGTKNLKQKLQILETTVKNLTLNDAHAVSENGVNGIHKIESEISIVDNNRYEGENQAVVFREQSIEPANVDIEQTEELSANLKIFLQQYRSSKINSKLEIPKYNELLRLNNLHTVLEFFLNFLQYMSDRHEEETNVKLWCYQYYLKHLSKIDFEKEFENLTLEEQPMSFSSEAFRAINFSSQCSCKCLFPLPSAKNEVPDFYEVGCAILKRCWNAKSEQFEVIHKEVPFIWKYIIGVLKNNDKIGILLPLLIQFGDEDLIAIFLNKFKYDTWDEAIRMLIKLKKNICVNCDTKFDKNCNTMNWAKLGALMVQSIGGPSTIHLLTRYANFIPSHELDSNFYQSCIFATAADNFCGGLRKQALNFTKTMQSDEEVTLQFDKLMAVFLQKSYVKRPIKYTKHCLPSTTKSDLKCSFCDLPLDIPLLKDDVKLDCNHLYHKICLKYNKDICKICIV